MSTSPAPDPDAVPLASTERRRSRERALEVLYEAECKGSSLEELLAELPVQPDAYASDLILGVGSRLEEIDDLLDTHSAGWPHGRMPAVDRCLLRIATYELLGEPAVPVAVVIDEAVELAKGYSTEDSGRFLNGVLAAIASTTRNEP
ncbi:MAG: transcription antitermination factor NusB [Acidimicrobiales bacterium]